MPEQGVDNGMLCCAQGENLIPEEWKPGHPNYGAMETLTKRRCKVCGARHYNGLAEPQVPSELTTVFTT